MSYKKPAELSPFYKETLFFLVLSGGLIVAILLLFWHWQPLHQEETEALTDNPVLVSNQKSDDKIYRREKPIIKLFSPVAKSLRDFSGILSAHTSQNSNLNRNSYMAKLLPQYNRQNTVFNDEDEFTDYSDLDPIQKENDNSDNLISYTIEKGDTLSKIFEQQGVKLEGVRLLMQVNKNISSFKVGQKIYFKINKDNQLTYFRFDERANKQFVYQREGDQFVEKIIETPSEWQELTFKGKISSNFGSDGRSSGLTGGEISQIQKILQTAVDFNKIQKEDSFSVVVDREILNGQFLQSRLKAIKFTTRKQNYYAFLANDGRYYDEDGKGLSLAFRQRPVNGDVRISSQFNPHRLHPVTHKVAPHNGVDFAVSRGTPIYAVADGQVVNAQYSATAGNYITIKHNSQYTTRYMHNDKLLVKTGDYVKKDQMIALSGNTGRSTGPHLHYELHVNGVPVDPLKASLPKSLGLTGKEKSTFVQEIKSAKLKLDQP